MAALFDSADTLGFRTVPNAASIASKPYVVARTIDLVRAPGFALALLPSGGTVEFLNLLLLALGIVPSPGGCIRPEQIPMSANGLRRLLLRSLKLANSF